MQTLINEGRRIVKYQDRYLANGAWKLSNGIDYNMTMTVDRNAFIYLYMFIF